MLPGTDQLRLLWAAMLVAMPLAAGYRFARRLQPPVGAIGDAILISYLIQYAAVGFAGALGFLSPACLTLLAVAMCASLWISAGFLSPSPNDLPLSRVRRRWVLGIFLGAFGFVAALVYSQRFCPPLATDALTYHLPAAVLWLQKKRIVLFQTWFFNPANTFSPLAGSMFATWLLAPMGNDTLARFVQVGPWFLIFFSVMNLGRSSRAAAPSAALAGLAAVMSRPFISQCILAKDDLFVAGFFLSAVSAISADRMSSRFGSARFGTAVGLMLATKYTALMSLPILLLAVDAPWRAVWRWRQWGVAMGAIALIAGPWYLRNAIYWGNPLFPMRADFAGFHLPGLFSSIHVPELRTMEGLWRVITGGYYGMPAALFILLSALWLMAVARFGRAVLRDPLRRLVVLGPPVGILVFALFSPQEEVRFLLPAFGLMFALCPTVAAGWRAIVLGAAAALLAIATGFSTVDAGQVVNFAMWGVSVAMAGLLLRWFEKDFLRFRRPILTWAGIAILMCVIGLRWNYYLDEYRDSRMGIWETEYPAQAAMWSFVDNHVPPDVTVAYSNQFMIYPLYGFRERRKVTYAPVRQDASISSLSFPAKVSDIELNQIGMDAANLGGDPLAWKQNMRAIGAEYLVVGRWQFAPEFRWAEADPSHFVKVFQNADSVVYRVDWRMSASESAGLLLK
jgi:hypothetical protein